MTAVPGRREQRPRRGGRQPDTPPPDRIEYRWIDDQSELDELATTLAGLPRYALDTEFHRERTYYPKLALVQIAWETPAGQELALIDPLAVDVTGLATTFDSDAVCVFHAAQQDLDVLTHSVGTIPRRMVDTQIAAGFVGYGTPSLSSLLQGELGVTPAKGDRLTDWLRRPLSESQRQYAAVDVEYLLPVYDRLAGRLDDLDRLAWATEAYEELRTRPVSGADPEAAWRRLKDARSLRPRGRAIAQSIAAWRERRAMRLDVPVRQVLPDLAVLGISQRAPSSEKELTQARGVDERHTRGAIAGEILDAVRVARDADPPEPAPSNDDLDRSLRPAVTLISAWVAQLARDERIDTALLATRADIVAFLRGDDDARLRAGWRSELVGHGIEGLVGGTAGLTFDGEGRLRLIPVAPAAAATDRDGDVP